MEFKIFALYHELGHLHTTHEEIKLIEIKTYGKHISKWKTSIERTAWKHAIRLAKSDGIIFSYPAYKYAISQLSTYYTYNGWIPSRGSGKIGKLD